MFSFIKVGAIVGVISLGAGFAAGWRAKDVRCDLASTNVTLSLSQQRIEQLEARIKIADQALEADAEMAKEDAEKIAELERNVHELVAQTDTTTCLSVDDVSRLRELFKRK